MSISLVPSSNGQPRNSSLRVVDPALSNAIADQYLDANGEIWQHLMVPERWRHVVEARSAERKSMLRLATVVQPTPRHPVHPVRPARIAGVELSGRTSPARVVALSGLAALVSLFASLLWFVRSL